MNNSDFFNKLYSKRDFQSQAAFINDLFSAGGCTYFMTLNNPSNSYEKKIFQGSTISNSIIDCFPNPIYIDGIKSFFKKRIKTISLPSLCDKFCFPTGIEQDFDILCLALALQFEAIIKNAPNEADDLVFSEYKKLINDPLRGITITKTLKRTDDFDQIFTRVPHSEKLTTPNGGQLNLFHLNINTGHFKFDALESFLIKNIVNYVKDRITIDEYKNSDDMVMLAAKALGAFAKAKDLDEKWLDNELGNILIYAFLEQVLAAPKLYNKIELLASGHGTQALSSGGVHLYNAGTDTAPSYQIVFGKSNISNDIVLAIDAAIDEAIKVVKGIDNELNLIDNPVLSTLLPIETSNLLANILKPSRAKNRLAENAFGIFLGYSLSLPGVSNTEFTIKLVEKMQSDIITHSKYISDKLTSSGIDNHSFYFYFFPFNNAEIEKKSVMQNILRGGR